MNTVEQVRELVKVYDKKLNRADKDAEYKLIQFAESLASMAKLKKYTCANIAREVFNS